MTTAQLSLWFLPSRRLHHTALPTTAVVSNADCTELPCDDCSVQLLDAHTPLVAKHNNYPGVGGRNLGSDNTEFLKISLANPAPEPGTYAMLLAGLGLLGVEARCRKAR